MKYQPRKIEVEADHDQPRDLIWLGALLSLATAIITMVSIWAIIDLIEMAATR